MKMGGGGHRGGKGASHGICMISMSQIPVRRLKEMVQTIANQKKRYY